ncbi:MAG: nitrophenyl compound nitroreductase subunit ArsF family protein [Thermoguttaceae bacterium]|jgi:thiol-disulfide isomerase/thioredoxin
MNTKKAFTICLLLFVAAAITVLTVKSLHSGPQAASAAPPIQNGVVVYYFHGNTRCPTCRNIEAYAHEAVESGFADELKSKQILWQAINYETPGNDHFATDYEFVAPIVVLVMFKDGKQVKWKGLPEVWEHVGDKPTFVNFVQTSLTEFLLEKGTSK